MDVKKLDYAKNLHHRIEYFKELLDKVEKMKKANYVHIMETDNKYCAVSLSGDLKLQILEILHQSYSNSLQEVEKEFTEL